MKQLFAAFSIILLVGVLMGAGSSYSSAAQTKESISNIGLDIGLKAADMNEDASVMFLVYANNDESMPVQDGDSHDQVPVADAEIVYPVYLASNGWFASSNRYLCNSNRSLYSVTFNTKSLAFNPSGNHRLKCSK